MGPLPIKRNLTIHEMRLGDRLRLLRRSKGLSQNQLAVLSYTSQSVIQKIENYRSTLPRCVLYLAEALDVTPGFLLFGDKQACDMGIGLSTEAWELAKKWDSLNNESNKSTISKYVDFFVSKE